MIRSSHLFRLFPPRKGLIVVRQGEPISHVVNLDLLHGLLAACLTDIQSLDDRLDVLLACELQHLKHLRSAPDMATADLASVGGKVLRHQLGQGLVGQTHVMKFAVHRKGGHVLRQVERVRHVGAVQDKVKHEGPWFRPLLVLGANKLLGAQRKGVFLLIWTMRNSIGFCA